MERWRFFGSLVVALTAGPRVAEACKCPSPELAEAVAGADAVFLARSEGSTTSPGVETFAVERVWKGQLAAVVRLENSAGSCKFIFEAGARYLVFARAANGALELDACSGTRHVDFAADWLAALGPDAAPRGAGSSQTPESEVPKTRAGCNMDADDGPTLWVMLVGLALLRRRRC